MRYAAKLLGLVAVTAVMVPFAEIPGFFRETGDLMPAALAQSADARKVEADRLFQQGIQQAQISQLPEAIQSWEQALASYRAIGDWIGEWAALRNLGLAYDRLGDYRRAIGFHEQALEIAREIGDRGEEGEVLEYLGIAHYRLGNSRRAIGFHEQALAIAREIGDRGREGAALGNLGLAYFRLGDYRQAIAFHEQHLAIAREMGDQDGEGGALGNLGIAYWSLGDYRRAIAFHEQHLAIAREIDDRGSEERALGNLGLAYDSLGNYRRAIEFHEQSLAIARELGNRSGEGRTLGNLGIAYDSLGEFRRAIEFHEQHRLIAQEIGNRRGEGRALGNLGVVYSSLGDFRRAIDSYEQALAIARELGNRSGEMSALSNLGIVYRRIGDFRRAIDFYEKSLTITRETGDRHGEGTALNNLGNVYLGTEQFALAETVLTQALDILDSLRDSGLPDADKISLFETQRSAFHLLQRALVAQEKVGPALEIAERGRGRAFAELLSQRLSSEEAFLDVTPPQIDNIKALAMQQRTTLVEYSLIQFNDYTALYIWVVSPTGDITFRRQSLDGIDLASLVTTARDAIGVRGDRATIAVEPTPEYLAQQQARTEANLRQLYDLLIAPIADLLPTDAEQPVVFMPQDELFLVPFAALKAPSGSYLIENHTILTAPSIQVFGLATDIPNRRLRLRSGGGRGRSLSGVEGNALIVGNPTMPTVTFLSEGGTFQDVRLSPLPGAQREAEAISGFLQTPALLGSAATKASVQQRMAGVDVVHLATHGLLEYGDPRETGTRDLPGAIALAPGSGDDGLLTAAEILAMDLQANLAILSACDTGRGRITGDGVVGLSRAFVAAGVPSIIVSLWAVDDAATADLMVAFYDNWQQSGDKAQALRQAMLTTMEQHPDPRLWAAFTLIGSAE